MLEKEGGRGGSFLRDKQLCHESRLMFTNRRVIKCIPKQNSIYELTKYRERMSLEEISTSRKLE